MPIKAIVATFMFLLCASNSLAKTYVCDVKSVETFDSGYLRPIQNEQYWLSIIKNIVFDEDSGLLKYGSENSWEEFRMTVPQRGTKGNDTIGIFMGKEGVPLNTLRIRPWSGGIPFVWDNGGDFFTGNCKVLGP